MDEIQQLADKMNTLVTAGDIPGILRILTDDVIFLPPNDTPKVGKEQYHAWVQQFQDRFAVKPTTVSREVQIAGDWAYEWGLVQETYTPRQGGGPTINFDGKFLRTFQRQSDGSWKIARAIWNSNHPDAA
jgi:ketosteroid isomerase-like protein